MFLPVTIYETSLGGNVILQMLECITVIESKTVEIRERMS